MTRDSMAQSSDRQGRVIRCPWPVVSIPPWRIARPDSLRIRRDGIVPLAVEIVTRDVDRPHLALSELEAFGVEVAVDLAAYFETCLGAGRADELDDDLMTDQRLPAHPNVVDVDHPPRIAFRARVAPSAFAILFLRSSRALDSLVSRRALK